MLTILKFKPIFKERIWGGRKLETKLGKKLPAGKTIGESWDISGVQGDISVVAEGKLKGNTLQELIEIYMGDLVGESVYERFGDEFPLLIKLIDAQDDLSIQVHPSDEIAGVRHHSYGKTEMWYVIDSEPDSHIYIGFDKSVNRATYTQCLEKGKLEELLRSHIVKPDDSFFIPSGTVHSIGKGSLISEIQQTSDITYRIYDFNRKDDKGQLRELHTELALDAIDFTGGKKYDITQNPVTNDAVELASCKYFATTVVVVNGIVERDYSTLDSFVVYICLDGQMVLNTEVGSETICKGETVLIPAVIETVTITGNGKIIETYVPESRD